VSIAEKFEVIADAVYEKGLNDGNKSQYDEFWDGVQNFGSRTNYMSGFMAWGMEYIRPKYKIVFKQNTTYPQYYIFRACNKLKKIEKEYFDFTQFVPSHSASSTSCWYYTFGQCSNMEYFEDLGCQAGGYFRTWYMNQKLHTIEVMRCAENSQYDGPIRGCTSLRNLTIEGKIGTSFSASDSPLSVESVKSIMTALVNYKDTENEGKYTLTLNDECKTVMAQQGQLTEFGNKTYDAYIADIGWNLA
jgi:hypothetical protein